MKARAIIMFVIAIMFAIPACEKDLNLIPQADNQEVYDPNDYPGKLCYAPEQVKAVVSKDRLGVTLGWTDVEDVEGYNVEVHQLNANNHWRYSVTQEGLLNL